MSNVKSKYIVRINYGIGDNPRYDTQYFESLGEVIDYMDRPTSAESAQSYLAGNGGIEVFELSPVIVLRV